MFAQHFHDATGDIEFAAIGIVRLELGKPGLLGCFVNSLEPVGSGFVGTKDAKRIHVAPHNFGEKLREHGRGRGVG